MKPFVIALGTALFVGVHTMPLAMGGLNHVPHDPPVISDVITIVVE